MGSTSRRPPRRRARAGLQGTAVANAWRRSRPLPPPRPGRGRRLAGGVTARAFEKGHKRARGQGVATAHEQRLGPRRRARERVHAELIFGPDPLNQAAREVVLLEASDWEFLYTTGQARQYATDRFVEHVNRFNDLATALEEGNAVTANRLAQEYGERDNPFPDMDYRLFARRQPD